MVATARPGAVHPSQERLDLSALLAAERHGHGAIPEAKLAVRQGLAEHLLHERAAGQQPRPLAGVWPARPAGARLHLHRHEPAAGAVHAIGAAHETEAVGHQRPRAGPVAVDFAAGEQAPVVRGAAAGREQKPQRQAQPRGEGEIAAAASARAAARRAREAADTRRVASTDAANRAWWDVPAARSSPRKDGAPARSNVQARPQNRNDATSLAFRYPAARPVRPTPRPTHRLPREESRARVSGRRPVTIRGRATLGKNRRAPTSSARRGCPPGTGVPSPTRDRRAYGPRS